MLASDTPVLGCCSPNALKYWYLPIIKNYPLPRYYIGQLVLHCIPRPNGQILHPVTVIGMFWSGSYWIYTIEFPPNHPEFIHETSEIEEVEEHQLEPI